MRHFAMAFALLALGACGERQPSSTTADAGCERVVTQQVTWSNADAPDTITARSEGPSCAQAVVLLVARNADGDPLWSHAMTYHDLNTGGPPPPDAPAVSAEQMDTFLRSWADVTVTTSNALPEWRDGDAGPAGEGPLSYDAATDRPSYEAIRAQNLRVVCFAAAVESSHCLFIDPQTGVATMLVASGI